MVYNHKMIDLALYVESDVIFSIVHKLQSLDAERAGHTSANIGANLTIHYS